MYIQDIDDEKPRFLSANYTFKISEYSKTEAPHLTQKERSTQHIGEVTAVDLDFTSTFSEFTYTASKEASELGFRIHQNGQLTSSIHFDRETVANYTVSYCCGTIYIYVCRSTVKYYYRITDTKE